MRIRNARVLLFPIVLTSMVGLLLINSPAAPVAKALLAQGPEPTLQTPPKKTSRPRKTPPSQKQAPPTANPKVVYISNVSEFIRAIKPHVEIKLRRGVYNLSNARRINTQYVRWRKFGKEYEPVISSVRNLTISGEAETKVLIDPYIATVLTFEDSSKIRIQNVTVGHSKETGACIGNVLAFRNVDDVEINDSILFGSGAHGLYLTQTTNMMFTKSTIRGCTVGTAYIRDSERIHFDRSIFKDNSLYNDSNLIEVVKSEDITFSHCNIKNNNTIGDDAHVFNVDEYSKNVVLSNSQITGNNAPKFINVEQRLMMSTNTFGENSFDR